MVVSGVRPGDSVALTVESASGATVPGSALVVMLVLPS